MLDERTDRKPYFYDAVSIEKVMNKIDSNKKHIAEFVDVYPQFKEYLLSEAFREKNFLNGALTFLALDGHHSIGIVPTENMSKEQIEAEDEKMHKIECYFNACKYIYDMAHDESYYEVDAPLLLKAHALLDIDTEKGNRVASYRFRNESDPEIVMKGTCFQPVPGDLVDLRVQYLFTMFNTAWYHDPLIVRGAKFITEYFRIQPSMDGNKRTALMGLNFMLLKNGYPEIYFQKKDHHKLLDSFEEGILTRDVTSLSLLIANKILARQEEINQEIINYRIETFMKTQG